MFFVFKTINLDIIQILGDYMKHKKNIIISFSFVITVLVIICAISIYYNFCGGFYFSRISKYAFILGEDNKIEVNSDGAYITACNFSGTVLTDNDIKQEITILSKASKTLYLRAKIQVVGMYENNIMFGYTNWVQNEDGYIYFNQPLLENEQIGLCKYIRLNKNNKFESNFDYILVVIVEASISPFESSRS